jgi:hypothetical protein
MIRPTRRACAAWPASICATVRLFLGGAGRLQLEMISSDMGVFIGTKRLGCTGWPTDS